MKYYQKIREESHRLDMDEIKTIADSYMKKVEYTKGRMFPVRDTVVVNYEDLLRIWDIADRQRNCLPPQVKTVSGWHVPGW